MKASVSTHRVYPRVCGGTGPGCPILEAKRGLSPRVRGNRVEVNVRASEIGSIPACAGEPRARGRTGSSGRVYPRVCGGTFDRIEQT